MNLFRKNKEKSIPDVHEKINQNEEQPKNSRRFFDKIAFLQMSDQRKAGIADEILSDTNTGKLYRLELVLSSVVATLWLLTNSIPVVIGAMLIAPILQPIKAFSFAVTTGNRHIYFRAMRVLWLSILVAISSSFLITLVVPFADLTTEVLARTSPTIVDLFIALASGLIAVLSLGFKKLSESIAGVAMAVALMPPLCVIGVGLQFLNRDVTAGSWLLFLTNLVAIIVMWIIVFYAFGFFPTNKIGQKRSATMTGIIVVTIAVLTIPLRKAMKTIADNFRTRTEIHETFDGFRSSINPSIDTQKVDFQSIDDKTLGVNATINIPDSLKITNDHKKELTERLAVATQKSIELQLNLIGVSSVYIDPQEELSLEKELEMWFTKTLNIYPEIIIIDLKIAQNNVPLVLLTLFWEDKTIFGIVEEQLDLSAKEVLWDDAKLLIDRQSPKKKKQEPVINEEIQFFGDSVEKQFALLLPEAEIISLDAQLDSSDQLIVKIEFSTSKKEETIKKYLESRQSIMQKYFKKNVLLKTKVDYISEREFN